MAPRALLRFDVSPAIGAGHMSRCLALAGELDARGWEIVCAVNGDGLQFLPDASPFRIIPVAPGAVQELASAGEFQLAIIDHYALGADAEQFLRGCAERVVAIDDLADRPHAADVLIDSAPGQERERYRHLVPPAALTLLGADYALLRPEFRAARSRAVRHRRSRLPRILVSMGATDPGNITGRIIEVLRGISGLGAVTVVLGRGAPHTASVREMLATLPMPGELCEGVADMAGLVQAHDLTIGAPGTSALERACLGARQILVDTAPNQAQVATGLVQAGGAVGLGPAELLRDVSLAEAIAHLLEHEAAADAMAAAGAAIVDGAGAARAAAILTAEPRDKHGTPLAARRIRAEDTNVLFAWQCHPATRRFSFDPAPPDIGRHGAFMAGRIADRDAISEIVTRHGTPVAVVRADPREGEQAVSIVVDPALHGEGLGRAALGYLSSLVPTATLTAHVDHRNAASIGLFRSTGYGEHGRLRLIIEHIPAVV